MWLKSHEGLGYQIPQILLVFDLRKGLHSSGQIGKNPACLKYFASSYFPSFASLMEDKISKCLYFQGI